MDGQSRILQQGIQLAAFQRRWKHAVEGVGGEQHERQESDADHAHHRQYACHHLAGQVAAEGRNGDHPAGQN